MSDTYSVIIDFIVKGVPNKGIKCLISSSHSGNSVKIDELFNESNNLMNYLTNSGENIANIVRKFINSNTEYRGSNLVIRTNSKSTVNKWESSASDTSSGSRGGKVKANKKLFDQFLRYFENIPVKIMFLYVHNLDKYEPVSKEEDTDNYVKPSELFGI